MTTKAKAYSYLRFSTPEQQKGDSRRRQVELARRYADAHGLDLDEALTFHDLGVSAFRGSNLDAALGAFKSAAADGRVPKGSYLLVESLDRLSRQAPWEAINQFQAILALGIIIVTLQDGKVWTHDDLRGGDVLPLLSSLLVMARAFEESDTKSKRLKAAWGSKRARAAEQGHKLTAQCPAWLTLDKSAGTFQVIEARALVIQRIFTMALEGLGKAKIAAQFNTEGVPTFGRSSGWQVSYIQKVLDNEAVIGTFQAHRLEYNDATSTKVRIRDGEPIEAYFPAIVDPAVFHRARELRSSRRIASGQTGRRFANVFSGLAKCGVCGASMSYVNKGKGWTYLHCSNARRKVGNCTAHPWPYQDTEVWLLWIGIDHINFREVYPSMVKGAQAALKALGDARVTAQANLERTRAALSALLDAIQERQDNPHLLDRLDTLSGQEKALTVALVEVEENIRQEQDRLDSAGADFEAVRDALGEWFKEQDEADDARAYQLRARLNQVLKRLVAEIRFHPGHGGKDGKSGRKVEVQLRGTVMVRDPETGETEENDGYILEMM